MARTLTLLIALLLVACATPPAALPTATPPTGQTIGLPTITTAPGVVVATATPAASAEVATVTALSTAVPPTVAPTTSSADYLAAPPARMPSPARVTHGKSYPDGAYEFIHQQFDLPAPIGDVPAAFIDGLPGVAEGQCPLTGEPAPEGIASRRPINIRIDNSPQGRPQAGLESADLIWETMAEGGVSRFTATFHCRTPATVGPLRSARLVDLQLTPMLGAWLVHVGASQPVTDMIWAAPYAGRDIDEWAGDAAFYRIDQAPVDWMRTYSSNPLIQSVIAAKGATEPPPTPLRGWTFSTQPAAGGTAVSQLTVPYGGGSSDVFYRYDPATQRYFRYQGQTAHTVQSGAQIAPQNLIVIYAEERVTPIVEDSLGNSSLHYTLWGSGPATLFRDGLRWDVTWRREGENALLRVVDAAGTPLPLRPGQSVIHIVPTTTTVQ
ncbi:MAG: DUF3048 domain-containing protein [Anaerolineales bacterium]|nr:DUF3048 domain-containing protein [Anaerolineales bacterium]MCB9128113.1 DUF3048 domain-containing protein [Ardenticatenales bacterium]MCB9171826.1 DUF3048 domain-containing protein [Ardenticatenales bacterium]